MVPNGLITAVFAVWFYFSFLKLFVLFSRFLFICLFIVIFYIYTFFQNCVLFCR
ncbi:hypothetical protein BY996DRAFT_7175153 [Phakopsora pachyrhizi]|nr:hypothetical protein BY996DRAFT_7175153 [Phakopsora pachyrhizi]